VRSTAPLPDSTIKVVVR
jgi:hypothetical protein